MSDRVDIRTERVYGHLEQDGTARYLVERLWPRGIKKQALHMDGWLRDVSPSPELRKWYGHDVARWEEFQQRYRAELDAEPAAWQPLLEVAHRGPVTLLYAAHDTEHNSALVLRDYLLQRL